MIQKQTPKNEHPRTEEDLRKAINRRKALPGGVKLTFFTPSSGRPRETLNVFEHESEAATYTGNSMDPDILVGKPFWAHVLTLFKDHTNCIVG